MVIKKAENIEVERHPYGGLVIYEISGDELDTLEKETAAISEDLSFALVGLSFGVAFSISLATTKIESDRTFAVFVLVTILSYLDALYFGIRWLLVVSEFEIHFQALAATAAFNVLRIHSERDTFAAFAVISYERNSFGVDRTRTVAALAFPFGSAGRPTFLGLGIASKLLDDEGSYGCCRAYNGWNMKNGNVLYWLLRVACIVQPGIGRVRLRVTFQVKDFDDSIPNRLAVEYLLHWNANLMGSSAAV